MEQDLLEGLNEAQRKAVTHISGPLLIVAGAGTGKTTVLTRRYAHLLNQGLSDGTSPGLSSERRSGAQKLTTANILALTFTEKAAGEMEDRVLALLPTGTYDFWISTFHGFCQRILEAHALEIGLPHQFRVLTTTDAWLLLKRRFDELPLDHYRPLGNPVKFLRALLQHVSRAKDEGVTPERYLEFAQNTQLDGDSETVTGERKRLQELADIYFAYRKILLDEGCLDFGDLILETLRLFRERPMILQQYQEQFTYLMVDEFQDTNWAQYELIKLLSAKHRNLTVVGDDDQAIYKFRGASLANILQFRDDFSDAVTVALTENYRSKREVLDCAYTFIRKNDPNRLEVRLKDTGLSKQLQAARGEGGIIDTIWAPSIDEEAEAIVEDIKAKRLQYPETSWNDFAVLVRSNDGAEPFVRAFEHHGVPFQFMALRGLYAKPPVLDAIAILGLLDGYHESSAVWRVFALPCYNLPARDRAELLQLANRKGLPLWRAVQAVVRGDRQGVEVSDLGLTILKKIESDAQSLAARARRDSPFKVLQAALQETGYLATILKMEEGEKREVLQWLNAFASRVKRYESQTHGPSLKGFLEELQLEIDSGEEGALEADPEAGPELVKILTVHAAKGLEFKHVYIVSLVEQRFPSRARPEAIPLPAGLVQERLEEGDYHLEEERRLFYVAVTRAKDTLTFSGASDYGGSRLKKPSPFWAEAQLEVPQVLSSGQDLSKALIPPEEIMMRDSFQEQTLYPLKRRFSFTQLAAFRKCPMQYKFAHIYRIPILGSYQKSFGQSVHLAFQRILELHQERSRAVQVSLFGAPSTSISGPGLRVTEEEALGIFEEAWIDEWYETRGRHDEYYEKGRAAIRAFQRAYAQEVPEIVELEKDFTLILGQHSIKGKIDRVDRLSDGSLMVLDYKTGSAKDSLEAEDKEQLYLYQIALEERGLLVGRLAYVYVLDWKFMDVEPLKGKAREAFLDKLEKRMDEVLRSDYKPTPDAFTCKFCEFKNICEFRKLG